MTRYEPGDLVSVRIGLPKRGVEWVPGIVEEIIEEPRVTRYNIYTAQGVLKRCHPSSLRSREPSN